MQIDGVAFCIMSICIRTIVLRGSLVFGVLSSINEGFGGFVWDADASYGTKFLDKISIATVLGQ